ncbi:MAG: ComF family protein [Cellulosilyticaceae bacterium]
MTGQEFMQWLYPDKCIICGKLLERPQKEKAVYTCVACESYLDEVKKCPRCGRPYVIQDTCTYCHEIPEKITAIRGLFPYVDAYKESILRWKYRGIRKYARGYAELIVSQILEKEKFEIECLIPIPIAPNRYGQRGFNQAEDLAQAISEQTGIPVLSVLERTHGTKPQSACTKEERRQNIRGTVKIIQEMPKKYPLKVAFIDDIYTTGSTVLECIKVLHQAQWYPSEIYIFTVGIAI